MRSQCLCKRAALVILAVVMLVSLHVSCAPKEEVSPAEEKVVTLIAPLELTGPYSEMAEPALAALQDYFAAVNESGGIGRENVKVKVAWADNKYDVALGLSAWERLKTEKNVFMGFINWTNLALPLKDKLESDQIPIVTTAFDDSLYLLPAPWVYTNKINVIGMHILMCDFFAEDLWNKKNMGREPKVAILAWDMPLATNLKPGLKKYFEDHGWPLVYEAAVPLGTMDFTVEASKLKESGADMVIVGLAMAAPGALLRDLGKAGALPDVVPIFGAYALGPQFLALAEDYGDYAYGAAYFSGDLLNSPPKDIEEALMARYGNTEKFLHYAHSGWTTAKIAHNGLEKILKKMSYKDFTSGDRAPGLVFREEGLKGLRLDSGLGFELSYADYPGDRVGQDSLLFVRWNAKDAVYTDVTGKWRKCSDEERAKYFFLPE